MFFQPDKKYQMAKTRMHLILVFSNLKLVFTPILIHRQIEFQNMQFSGNYKTLML